MGAEYTQRMTQSIKWLQDEIAARMLQKLDIIKLVVKSVLVFPDFLGAHANFLAKRFSGLRFYSAPESSLSGFNLLRFKASLLWSSKFKSCANISLDEYRKTGRIGLNDNSVDLVFSNLLIQDLPDPKHFLGECWRVLKEGGLLSLSYLGPDTGKELRAMEISALSLKTLASPWDMHDMGDALLGKGFSDPVMDMEFLNLDYESDSVLLADAGSLNLIEPVNKDSLVLAHLPKKLTLEVIYGHAWAMGKHLARAQDQLAYIDPNQIQRKTRNDAN